MADTPQVNITPTSPPSSSTNDLLMYLHKQCMFQLQMSSNATVATASNGSRSHDEDPTTVDTDGSSAYSVSYNATAANILCGVDTFEQILRAVDGRRQLKYGLIALAYCVIILISFFGNSFVVGICFGKRRMRTTVNIFIGNLALSDLMMTLFNIPFTCARFLLDEWIFGDFLCHVVPFVQATSVYVSTLTMTFIAVDRYQAIVYPIRTRLSTKIGHGTALSLIWAAAIAFSLPFALFNRVVEVRSINRTLIRCKSIFPEPVDVYRKTINLGTFIGQFAVPLSLMVILYVQIAFKIWSRKTIGATTQEQQARQVVTKRKTIMMLILVTSVFVICWLPLNVYHLLLDFGELQTNFNWLIVVHWTAMSSVCYNPFIYFWLNRRFQQVLKSLPCYCCSSNGDSTNIGREGRGSFSLPSNPSLTNDLNANAMVMNGRSRNHPFRQRRALVAMPRNHCMAGTDSSSCF